MTRTLSMISLAQLGPGAILEDINPTPQEFRVTQGAKSAAPVKAETPIDSKDDKSLPLSTQE